MRKKVRITTISSDHEVRYDTKAIIHDNSIVYIEKDDKKTKTYFNYDKNQLIRENKELSLKYNFDEIFLLLFLSNRCKANFEIS